MTLQRNVTTDEGDAIHRLPAEAIATLIERGMLSDWKRIADELDAEPWGRVADIVDDLAATGDTIAGLLREVAHQRRGFINEMARRRYAELVALARRRTGLSLREFAARVGTSASRLSDYENGKVSPTSEVIGRIEAISESITTSG